MSFVDLWKQHDFAAERQSILGKTPQDVSRALSRVQSGLDLEDLKALLSPAAVPRLVQRLR